MTRRCQDMFRGDRCELPAEPRHDQHRRGAHVWMFTDTRPEWLRRMDRGLLPAKELVG